MDRLTHRQIEEQIPDYLTSRLDPGSARRISEHLETCESCADFAAGVEPVLTGMRDGGATLLENHPDSSTLTAYGTGETEDTDGSIGRHLQTCLSCQLEVEVWKEQGQAPGFGLPASTAPATVRSFSPYRLAVAAMVAGLLFGVGLSNLSGPGSAPEWSGAVGLTVLERPLRGEAAPGRVTIAPGQPYVPLAAAPVVPAQATDVELYRFEIVDSGGESVWSHELQAGAIREALGDAGVVTFLVPSRILEPGRNVLRFGAAKPGSPDLLAMPFEVSRP